MAIPYTREPDLEEGRPPAVNAARSPTPKSFHCRSIVRYLPRQASATAAAGDNATAHDNALDDTRQTPLANVGELMLDADLVFSNSAAWCRSLAMLIAHVGREFDASLSQRSWRARRLADVYRGRRELSDVLDDYLKSLRLRRGERDEVMAAALAQWREAYESLHLLPGAREFLRRADRAGIRIALMADCPLAGAELCDRLQAIGLAGAFAAVVSSIDVDGLVSGADLDRAARAQLKSEKSSRLPMAETTETPLIVQAGALHPEWGNEGLICELAADKTQWTVERRFARLDELARMVDPQGALAKAG